MLLEKPGRHDGQLVGRSPYLQPVHLDAGGHRAGDLIPTRIVAVKANSLAGAVVRGPIEAAGQHEAVAAP